MTTKSEDRTRALLRAVSDSIKRLELIYNSGNAIKTIFSYEAYGYRLRLKETLQKLMFIDPTSHAKRAEELLWRKVFYEPLHLYKLYIKNNDKPDRIAAFELSLRMHILSGIGYYQSLLLQIQSETSYTIGPQLCSWLSTAFHIPLYNDDIYQFDRRRSVPHLESPSKIAQRCLMYIGDLFRYLIEFGEPYAKTLAYGYYSAALDVDPTIGLPHNQLGILDIGRCYGLNAIFHYLLCLGARVPFEGARGNLITVLTKNEVRYRKLFGEKPIYGLYVRHPYRYRPKDFRKTITKFIYIMQQFLKPFRSDWDRELSRVMHDALVEFHLMLTITSDLTLEPDLSSSDPYAQVTCPDPEDGLAEHVTHGEDYSLYSEQLTGPIFVRILMIALLTANLVRGERSVQLPLETQTTGSVASPDEPATKTDAVPDRQTEAEIMPEPVEVDEAQSCTDHSQEDIPSSSSKLQPDSPVMDPHGPLAFLLQLSQLYMEHILRQLRELLHAERQALNHSISSRRDRAVKTSSVTPQVATATNDDLEACSHKDHTDHTGIQYNNNRRKLLRPDDRAEQNATAVSGVDEENTEALEKPEDERQELAEDEEEPVHDHTTDNHDYGTRRRRSAQASLSSSSDEESVRLFGERGLDGDSEDDEEEEEDDDELSAELWSSDDSSLLHSQDELTSPAHSSSEDGESFPDHRLRRVPRLSNSALTGSNAACAPTRRRIAPSASSRLRSATEDHSTKFPTKNGSEVSDPSTENDRCTANDVSGSLDPITEEESATEEIRSTSHRYKYEKKMTRNQATRQQTTSDTDEDSVNPSNERTALGGPRYSKRIAANRVDIQTAEDHGYPESVDKASESIHEADICVRAKAISRLYLLPAVKIVVDWIRNAIEQHPNLVAPVFVSQSSCSSTCLGDRHDRPKWDTCPGLSIAQDWCAQLSFLLNELNPLIVQVGQECRFEQMSGELDSVLAEECAGDKGPKCEISISPLLSPFGKYALFQGILHSSKNDALVEPEAAEDVVTSPSASETSTDSAVKPIAQSVATIDKQQYALPEDWLLRGLASLAEKHEQINFTKSTILPAFTRIDEAILRSFYLVSFGHELARRSTHLPVQFTADLTNRKPFHSPTPPLRPDVFRPWHGYQHPYMSGWSYSHRRGRGRFAYRHHHHHYHPSSHYGGRGDFSTGTSRWSTARGHWSVSYPRPGRGSVHRGHSGYGHRSTVPTRPYADVHSDHRGGPPTRHPPGDSMKSESSTGDLESTGNTHCAESDDVSKQSSNSSLPHADVHPEHTRRETESLVHTEVNTSTGDSDSRKTQLMRDMARLRLLNEVDQLARRCQNASPRTQSFGKSMNAANEMGSDAGLEETAMPDNFVSPYVVLDAYCLASHLPSVRQLVNSGAFVLIIPVAVVAHLDYLKKTMATARVAIRYLEQETQGGNRYLRLQKPEEQPQEPFQLPKLVSPRNTTPGAADIQTADDDAQSETGLIANPRVVRRWLSILDCAVYYSQLKTSGDLTAVSTTTDVVAVAEKKSSTSASGGGGAVEAADTTRTRPTPRDGTPTTLINCPASCCDLLSVVAQPSRETSPEHDPRTSLVTVLIGSRDTVPEDTIVPRELLNLIQKAGIRLEILRDFVQRWKKSRRSNSSRFHADNSA